MKQVFTDRIIRKLDQLHAEIFAACNLGLDYHDRLRELKTFCDTTSTIAQILSRLPEVSYSFDVGWRAIQWPGGIESYGMRWNAIQQMVGDTEMVNRAWLQIGSNQRDGLHGVTNLFVTPIHHYIVDQLNYSSTMLYLLLRYKRWVEWFKAAYLRDVYQNRNGGENALDRSLRCFLFESGIDYPFSQPGSPHGAVDVVAGLETDDPLVLEIKVWDSEKNYRKNRIRDGLRQAMNYAARYGKDKGHIVVFNLDQKPLVFINKDKRNEWPPRIEYGGTTFFFIDVHIAEQEKPISQQDKGKRVSVIEIDLADLLEDTLRE